MKVLSQNIVMVNSIYNFVMAINISTHESVKNYSYLNVFNEKNINTSDILTFKQMRTDENKLCQIKKRLQVEVSAHTKK